MNVLSNLNLNRNELQNAVIQNLSTAPQNGKQGQVYFNTVDKKFYIFNGTEWTSAGAAYSQDSSTSAVITGLTEAGVVTTTNVSDLIAGKDEYNNNIKISDLVDSISEIESANYLNVQSNWTETDITSDAYILNKPSVYTKDEIDDTVQDINDTISGLSSAIAGGLKFVSKDVLPNIALMTDSEFAATTNGTIFLITKDNQENNNIKEEYLFIKGETKATSRFELIGDVKPSLEGYLKTEDLEDELANVDISDAKLGNSTVSAAIGDVSDEIANLSNSLATVATSGSYNDLTNKPKSIKTGYVVINSGNKKAILEIEDEDYEVISTICTDANKDLVYIDTKFSNGAITFEIADSYTLDIVCKAAWIA